MYESDSRLREKFSLLNFTVTGPTHKAIIVTGVGGAVSGGCHAQTLLSLSCTVLSMHLIVSQSIKLKK